MLSLPKALCHLRDPRQPSDSRYPLWRVWPQKGIKHFGPLASSVYISPPLGAADKSFLSFCNFSAVTKGFPVTPYRPGLSAFIQKLLHFNTVAMLIFLAASFCFWMGNRAFPVLILHSPILLFPCGFTYHPLKMLKSTFFQYLLPNTVPLFTKQGTQCRSRKLLSS